MCAFRNPYRDPWWVRFISFPRRLITSVWVSWYLRRREKQRAEIYRGSRIRWLIYNLTWPIRVTFGELWTLIVGWSTSRSGYCFLLGLPALLGLVGLIGCLIYYRYSVSPRLVVRYAAIANRAMVNREPPDYELARVCFNKLIQLEPTDDSFRFQLAMVDLKMASDESLDSEKKRTCFVEGNRLLESIAPIDKTGYPEAHFVMASRVLESGREVSLEELDAAAKHLQKALARTEKKELKDECRFRLAQICIRKRQLNEAEKYLEEVVGNRPALRLQLAAVQQEAGKTDLATRNALALAELMREQIRNKPEALDAYELLAKCQLFLKDFPGAVQTLTNAINYVAPGDGATMLKVRQAISEGYRLWAIRLRETANDGNDMNFAQMMECIDNSLKYFNANPLTINLLSQMVYVKPEEKQSVKEKLLQLLVDGRATATSHMVLGELALKEGNGSEAVLHFEQAKALAPSSGIVLNNLAWVCAHTVNPPPDFERALALADQAVKLEPEHPQVRHTRGTILFKLGKKQEALPDLEFALTSMSENLMLHELLAECYRDKGLDELAEKHTAKAKEIKAKSVNRDRL